MKTQNVAPVASIATTILTQAANLRDVGLKQLRRVPLVGSPVASLLRPKLIERASSLQRSVLGATVGKVKRMVVKTGLVK